jgi:hypothetical protein
MTSALPDLFAYLLQAGTGLGVFIGLYRLLLARLTFLAWNRLYLMGTAVISLLIPLVHFDLFTLPPLLSPPVLQAAPPWEAWVVQTPLALSVPAPAFSPGLLIWAALGVVYGAVTLYRLCRLGADIYAVIRLIRAYPRYRYHDGWVVCIDWEVAASSFFRFIFLSKGDQHSPLRETILRHEREHGRQGHSFDWLFVQLLGAIFWFHPLVGWWKKAVAENHEYLADAYAAQNTGANAYAKLLLAAATPKNDLSPLQYFSFGQLQSRTIMLHQPRSKAPLRMRFLLILPLATGLLLLNGCEKPLEPVSQAPFSLSPAVHLKKASGLIGRWVSTNTTVVNENHVKQRKQHRGLTRDAGAPATCFSELVLQADGQFRMSDTQTGRELAGNWRSDPFGVSVYLIYSDASSAENTKQKSMFLKDGTAYKGLQPSVIHLDVTSLDANQLEAWQHYPADETYSAASIQYRYKKD